MHTYHGLCQMSSIVDPDCVHENITRERRYLAKGYGQDKTDIQDSMREGAAAESSPQALNTRDPAIDTDQERGRGVKLTQTIGGREGGSVCGS